MKRFGKLLQYLLSALVTVVFLYLAFRRTDLHKLYGSIKSVKYGWIVLSVVLLFFAHYLRAWRWRFMLNPVKLNISMRSLFSGVMVGYMMNNMIPRAGELARPYAVGKLEDIPKSAAFGTIVIERLIDTLTFLLLVAALPLLYTGPLTESFPWLTSAGVIITLVTLGMCAFLIALMVRRDWANALLRIVERWLPVKFREKVDTLVHHFLDGLLFLKNPRHLIPILLLSVGVWGLYALMQYAAFFAFDLQGILGFDAAIVVLTISSIGIALPTPGGTGTYHAFVSRTLSQLFLVDATTALSYATVTHAATFLAVTVVGLYYFVHDHLRVSEAITLRDGTTR
jgi:glycosyltransferase 2 family protein